MTTEPAVRKAKLISLMVVRDKAPRHTPAPTTKARPTAVHFTHRQREVLTLLCEGLPNKVIARRLNIAPATVKVHIGHIFRELGVSSRLQAVVAARRLLPRATIIDAALRPARVAPLRQTAAPPEPADAG